MPRFEFLPQKVPRGIADPLGRGVARLGITPNMVSLVGFGGNLGAAWLITREELLLAGLVFGFFSALDFVDGAVARATGQASPFGAVFDAVLDRASEMIVIAAMAWYFGERGEMVQAGVAYAALFGSVAVSYARARAEIVGVSMREGLFRRQERVILVTVGLLLNGLTVVIWILAALTNLTALQRGWMIYRALRTDPQPSS